MKKDFLIENEVMNSFEQLDKTYFWFMMVMQLGTIVCVPIYGYWADTIDLRIPIPIAFAVRAIVCFSF